MALLQKAYLGATPLFRNTSWFEDNDYTLVNESGTVTVTANSTSHVKGSWSELVASSSANASLLYIRVTGISASGVNTATLLDIGAGASGSESVIVADVAVGGASETVAAGVLWFVVPIRIASSTRISARIQATVAGGETASIYVRLLDVGDYAQAPTSVDTYGSNTANSRGLATTAANTYVQITASTSRAYRALVLVPSCSDSSAAVVLANFTIAKGASGSETEIRTVAAGFGSSERVMTCDEQFIAEGVPSGTRLAVKVNGPTSAFSNYTVTIIGIP
jgi:hypothetical protein